MRSLFLTSLLTALGLPLSVIATGIPTQISSSQKKLASAWFESWPTSEPSDLANIPWEKYNSMTFAFATPSNDVSVINVQPDGSLTALVEEANKHGVNVTLSIGGDADSAFFSPAVNPHNVSTFVEAIAELVSQSGVHGLEIDWEFPGIQPSDGCNVVSSDDSANFLAFLQQLRRNPVTRNIMLSAAVDLTPWVGSNGLPLADVSAFASVLDYISIMNYDVWGPWSSTVGPNSPIDDTCALSDNQQGSAVSGVAAWTKAKFPASQILLGVPSYGYSFSVAPSDAFSASGALNPYARFNESNQPLGDTDTPGAPLSFDQCGNPVGPDGTFDFKSLIKDGFLTAKGTNATGIDFIFDSCSQTPFIYNARSQVMIAYDDAASFAAKGKFIAANGLKGYSMWHVAGDSNNILVDSINSAMGFVPNSAT